jgi:competence protein ComEC
MADYDLQTPARIDVLRDHIAWAKRGVDLWLEAERDQLPLWLPVGLGAGVAAWFILPTREAWTGFMLGALALACFGLVFGWRHRAGRIALLAGLTLALGCALVWGRSIWVGHKVLTRPTVVDVRGLVERVETKATEEKTRVTLRTDGVTLPERVRVTIKNRPLPPELVEGSEISIKARLAPPPVAALPGGYDFSRAAWFQGLGGVGQAIGDVAIITAAAGQGGFRQRLSAHIRAQVEGSAGGIASAFASGDRGGISPEDEDAMRASGLTHLLSISGLHVTAVVAATMFIALKLLALSPKLALNWPLLTFSAGFGALAGIGYTLLTGAEVPTIRSCVAALLVLLGLALGREALTLRLVATGAIVVLLLWPESLVGPSFQLSFAAITSIVALHEQRAIKALLARHEESWVRRLGRALLGLLLTGIAVEITLAPIALFHFHKSGLFGALANIIAIPLTTFVIMPAEALALLFDLGGIGAPFWWITGQSIGFLLWLAREVAAWPGAVALVPSLPVSAFALIVVGGLWLLLWSTRVRLLGLFPIACGIILTWSVPEPAILITNDGRHVAVRRPDGRWAILRERTGQFMRDVFAERAGETEEASLLEDMRGADCSQDLCTVRLPDGNRDWTLGATRSAYMVPWAEMVALCPKLDILVSERGLPKDCHPKWIKADRFLLRQTGGMAISFTPSPSVETTRGGRDDHPWSVLPEVQDFSRLKRRGHFQYKPNRSRRNGPSR